MLASGQLPQTSLFASAALSLCVCGRAAETGAGFGPWAVCGGISFPLTAADAEPEAGRAGPCAEAAGLEPQVSM